MSVKLTREETISLVVIIVLLIVLALAPNFFHRESHNPIEESHMLYYEESGLDTLRIKR